MTELLTIEMFDDLERDTTNDAFREIIVAEFGEIPAENGVAESEATAEESTSKAPFGVGLMAVESLTTGDEKEGLEINAQTKIAAVWTPKHDGTGNLKLDSPSRTD